VSEVVGQDLYELRIAGLQDGRGWKPVSWKVSAADKAAGVTIEALPQNETGWIRLLIRSQGSRAVKWNVEFKGNY